MVDEEFDRQIQNILLKDYPKTAGISEVEFLTYVSPLKTYLKEVKTSEKNLDHGTLPFVIVIKNDLVPTEKAMQKVERAGKTGITKMYPRKPQDFTNIENISIPQSLAYLLVDIDRGKSSLNVRPSDALDTILQSGRSPLTIDEGVALMTQYPEFLMKNNCFSLLGSRHPEDKRVPAIWINAQKQPNLGWCWNGNPHTWLGSASCALRIGYK